MSMIHRFASIRGNLLDEVASTTLSLDGVYAIYALVALGAVGLWAIGVLAFGRSDTTPAAGAERATPVAL